MNLHDIEVTTITGETIKMSAFAGKTLLVVNTATGCGLAGQFAGLEAIHRRFKDRGFAVLGFPCNQFAGQEPLSAEGIQETCRLKYDVTFPLFAKLDVNGSSAHPLYQHLKHAAPGLAGIKAIKWNFTKFLVNGRGEVVARFAPTEKPEALVEQIEAVIDGKAPALGIRSDQPPQDIRGTRRCLGLAACLALCFAPGSMGALFLPGPWHAGLNKPSWNPPGWIFGPVWSALYMMMAVAAWLVWQRGGFVAQRRALILFLIQLALNAAWTPLFFGLHLPAIAFGEMLLLWAAIAATLHAFFKVNRIAAWLLAPYLAWVSFAAVLNFTIWRLNP